MHLPKIIFRNSWLYDDALKRGVQGTPPPDKVINKHLNRIKKEWSRHERKILEEISKITRLPWHQKEIVCYVSYQVRPYSDPLTLNLKSNLHTLTHELIHRIVSEPENWKVLKKKWLRITQKYKKEKGTTKVHIIIHAIHGILLEKLFGEKILREEQKSVPMKEYVRAWEIAEKEGFKNILKNLRN